ncbi:Uncharacterized protein SCF082_LOCUS15533 [Durusdinium trenchii]|uniref:Uncharacterized protein n=1 Tax=Durusdinium trenchii TaxID=1381693 RepID=A0ABP0K5M6_9DINO
MFFVVDPKASSKSDGLRRLAHGDAKMYKTLGACLFENGLFRPQLDMLAMFDGRSVRTQGLITKHVLKPGFAAKLLPSRSAVPLRLMHHNREFSQSGWARARKGKTVFSATLPDPLETVFLAAGAERLSCLPLRQRICVDLPGDNNSKGWPNLSLRKLEDQQLNGITSQSKSLIFAGVGGSTKDMADEEEEKDASAVVCLCPWEPCEEIYAELFHCFGPDETKKMLVVDLSVGSGMAAVAAARHGLKYIGFSHKQLQSDLVLETVVLAQSVDILSGKPHNGFPGRKIRVLSRAASLGAETQSTQTPGGPDLETSTSAGQQADPTGANGGGKQGKGSDCPGQRSVEEPRTHEEADAEAAEEVKDEEGRMAEDLGDSALQDLAQCGGLFWQGCSRTTAKATAGSIALDVRDNLMLVSARWFYRNLQNNPWLPSTGVYEHLLGVVREAPEPNASAEAVKQIIRAACTKRVGQRSADSGTGPLDQLGQDLLDHVCATIQAAVADGGPAEQSALTTLKQENSSKYSGLFQKAQLEEGQGFFKTVKNFSFVLEAVHTMRVMFLKHGVLAAAGKDTLTQKALQIMQDTGVLHYWEGSRRQLAGSQGEDGAKVGLFARAWWFLENPASAPSSAGKRRKVSERGPFESKSGVAWVQTLAELRKEARQSRQLAVQVIEKALCLQCGTATVERWLGEVAQTELKKRAQHLCNWNLERAIKLNLQSLRGRRVGMAFQPDDLVDRPVSSASRVGGGVLFKASRYGLRAQQVYKDFFGEKPAPSRKLEGSADRSSEKPKLGNLQTHDSRKRTLQGELKSHAAAVKNVVQEATSAASALSWQPMVAAVKEVALARCEAGSGKRLRSAEDSVPGSSSDRKGLLPSGPLAEISRAQDHVAEKQVAVAKTTPPGGCVPYVDPKGGVFLYKLPAPAPTASLAKPLPESIQIFPANEAVRVPHWRRFSRSTKVAASDVVLCEDIRSDFFAAGSLLARLWGKRLADKQWCMTKTKGGTCIAFSPALQFHLHLYLHESFAIAHPELQTVLLDAVSSFAGANARQRLHAHLEEFPAKPAFPRLSYQIVSQPHLERVQVEGGKTSHLLNVERLFSRLSEVQRTS